MSRCNALREARPCLSLDVLSLFYPSVRNLLLFSYCMLAVLFECSRRTPEETCQKVRVR